MKKEAVILLVDDDDGHIRLIKKNLKRAGVANDMLVFHDGEEILNFLFHRGKGPHRKTEMPYLLLLDIRMPKIDGVEVLQNVKQDNELKKMPVIMMTTTDNPQEVEKCHFLGCSNYVTKPVDYDRFIEVVRQLGMFLLVMEVPVINGCTPGRH